MDQSKSKMSSTRYKIPSNKGGRKSSTISRTTMPTNDGASASDNNVNIARNSSKGSNKTTTTTTLCATNRPSQSGDRQGRQTNEHDSENKRTKSAKSGQRHVTPSDSSASSLSSSSSTGSTTGKRRTTTRLFKSKNDNTNSSQEMATTNLHADSSETLTGVLSGSSSKSDHKIQETDVDCSTSQKDVNFITQETDDDERTTLLDSQSSSGSTSAGPMLTSNDLTPRKLHTHFTHASTSSSVNPQLNNKPNFWSQNSLVLYHDDEEINQAPTPLRASSEEDEFLESGAALTLAEDSLANITQSESIDFAVYPVGCCEFDETQLVASNNTRAIQKCILKLTNYPSRAAETTCWGLDPNQPIMMRLQENYIQFFDLKTQALFKSQPINTIKTWAVDDDNNFAFVVEERLNNDPHEFIENEQYEQFVEYELLASPTFMCYVFSSIEEDDMSCRVAAKLNDEINKYKEQMSNRISKSTRLQQMVEHSKSTSYKAKKSDDAPKTDEEDQDDDDLEDLVEMSEMTMDVKYVGKVQVPKPMGIDVLNIAIDKALSESSKEQMNRLLKAASTSSQLEALSSSDDGACSPLTNAKLHVSPSSVIVENATNGDIIVECRIRYLTFMGISRRDIRWCGFIMQNVTNKTFEAHCLECYPTAGLVCEAIQASCSKMYEKMLKSQRRQADDTITIIPRTSKIRDTLAKTLSKIKLTPIIQ